MAACYLQLRGGDLCLALRWLWLSGLPCIVTNTGGACHTERMISIDLARKLRDAGLEWLPREGDRFMIPDRDLEDHVFSVSEMTIEVRRFAEGKRIMFNGAVEWALDSIMQQEVIWLPSEAQLRDRLGSAFRTLRREPDGFRCDIAVGNDTLTFTAADPAEAYGAALLALMEDPEGMLRVIVGDD